MADILPDEGLQSAQAGRDVPFIERTALLRKLDRARFGLATVIHAPAGYGKSALLNAWKERIEAAGVELICPFLDSSMRSGANFYGALSSALGASGKQDAEAKAKKLRFGTVETFARSLLPRLDQRGECVVILDGYEEIASAEVNEVVASLVRYAAPHVHLVIASRIEPDLGLAPERLGGAVTVLGAADLRFGDDEVGVMFPHASREFISRLSVMTEGWPFAVHLAAIHARHSPDDVAFLDRALTTSAQELGDFISDVMLRNLPPELNAILLETSFLPAFDAELAEAVTDVRACWQKLGELKRANIISPVPDAETQSYRCHPLLRSYLHRQLRARGPAAVHLLRWRAVTCYRARKDYRAAAQCARSLGDGKLSADIFLESGGILLNMERGGAYLQQALDLLPPEAMAHPRVRAAEACALAKRGRAEIARVMLDRIDLDHVSTQEIELVRRDVNIAMLTAAAYSSQGLLPEDWDRFTPLPVGGGREIATAEGFFFNLRCAVAITQGDMERALLDGQMAAHLYGTARALNGQGHVQVHLARALTELGRLAEAREHLHQAQAYFSAHSDYGGLALVDIFRARVDFLTGDLATAEIKVDSALRVLREGEYYWEALAVGYSLMASLLRLRGDQVSARNYLDAGISFARINHMDQLHVVLTAELAILNASGDAIDRTDGHGCADSSTLRLREDPHWLESYLHRRLKAVLLAQENRAEAAGQLLKKAAGEADDGGLASIRMDCLLDLTLIEEGHGARKTALDILAQAIELGAVSGMIAPFILRAEKLVPLLALFQNQERRGGVVDPRPFIGHLINHCRNYAGNPAAIFSPRERAVLELLAASKCNKEIARALDISPETVRFHLKRAYEKLGISMGYHNRKIVREIIMESGILPPASIS